MELKACCSKVSTTSSILKAVLTAPGTQRKTFQDLLCWCWLVLRGTISTYAFCIYLDCEMWKRVLYVWIFPHTLGIPITVGFLLLLPVNIRTVPLVHIIECWGQEGLSGQNINWQHFFLINLSQTQTCLFLQGHFHPVRNTSCSPLVFFPFQQLQLWTVNHSLLRNTQTSRTHLPGPSGSLPNPYTWVFLRALSLSSSSPSSRGRKMAAW